jgi:hypothetical protein
VASFGWEWMRFEWCGVVGAGEGADAVYVAAQVVEAECDAHAALLLDRLKGLVGIRMRKGWAKDERLV